ncbi:MAG: carotenoid biosynthesis protein [Anaerolineae bacterium]|nr:carotenoid biosynthesis protein [Anaerolineae bacterium]
MKKHISGRSPFIFLTILTTLSVLLIILNYLIGMRIPFKVDFLIGFVGGLLIFVIWHAILTKGWRRSVLMFSLSFMIAFTAEALGVNFGLIFGNYHYTDVLGIGLFGVPFLAAITWEPILYAAFCMSDFLSPSAAAGNITWGKRLSSFLWLAVVGALATTAWDMMIDPIAVSQGWWVWEKGGAYVPYVANGVPITNFMGWLAVSFVIILLYRLIMLRGAPQRHNMYLSVYGPLLLYAALFLTAFGVTLTVLRRPEVALIGLLAMGPFITIALTHVNLLQHGQATSLSNMLPKTEKNS